MSVTLNVDTLRCFFKLIIIAFKSQITMNDLPVGRSVDETLRLVQAFQYTDKHGEVRNVYVSHIFLFLKKYIFF